MFDLIGRTVIAALNDDLAAAALAGVRLQAGQLAVYASPDGRERLILVNGRWWMLVRGGRGELQTDRQAALWLDRHGLWHLEDPAGRLARRLRDTGYTVVKETVVHDPDWDEGVIEEALLRATGGWYVLASRTVEPEDLDTRDDLGNPYLQWAHHCWPYLAELTPAEAQQWAAGCGADLPSPPCPLAVGPDGTLWLDGLPVYKASKKTAAVVGHIIDRYPRAVPTKELKGHFGLKIGDPGGLLHRLREQVDRLRNVLLPPGDAHSGRGWRIVGPAA